MNDIARLAEVSKKTVSRVINESPFVKEDTRQKVSAIMRELSYEPDPQARGLAFRRSFLVGFIYNNPNPQYVVNAQQGILDGLKGSGLELAVRPCDRDSDTFLEEMRGFVQRQKLFGVILFPSVSEDERLAELLQGLDCPYVRVASVELDDAESMLVTNDAVGGSEAARHLADLGHRRVGHITGPLTFRSAHERRRGFAEGLAERGIVLDEAWVKQAGYTFESGLAAGRELLARTPRPTAIFAGNDEMALGAYQAARDLGLRVPDDVSIIGYDDAPIAARVWPALTTVRLPIRDMGRVAARKLMRQEGVDHDEADETVRPTLVVRASSGPAPAD
ncbi:MAG TPA: LacI family DNA-binding transcriptional regulator [Caulobacteraceae bacterium]|nr:LacI family DNA-binding transcriptional regulator [Caulobacteraceae bacterium]